MQEYLEHLREKPTRTEAIHRLKEKIGGPAVGPVIEAFGSKDRKLKNGATEAIAALGEVALPVLLQLGDSKTKQDRITAMTLLGIIPSEDDRLLALLYKRIRDDESSLVGKAAFQALLKKSSKSLPYLTRVAGCHFRCHSYIDRKLILEKFGDRLLPEIYKILDEEEDFYASDAPTSLLCLMSPVTVPGLCEWFEGKYTRPILVMAGIDSLYSAGFQLVRNALGNVKPYHRNAVGSAITSANPFPTVSPTKPENLEIIDGFLKSDRFHEQLAGILCAGQVRNVRYLIPVTQFLDSKDEGLIGAALSALALIIADSTQIPETMTACLYDENAFVQQCAVQAFRVLASWHHLEIPEAAKRAIEQSEAMLRQQQTGLLQGIADRARHLALQPVVDESEAEFGLLVLSLIQVVQYGVTADRIVAVQHLAAIGPHVATVVKDVDALSELDADPDFQTAVEQMLKAIQNTA